MKKGNLFTVYSGLPRGIYIIFVSRIIDNMGSVVMPMITLILTQKICFSKNQAGVLATIFMIFQAPFLLLGGKLVDKIGSKKVIVIFNTLGAIAYIPCGFIRPHFIMAALIAVASYCFSVAAPAYNAIVTEVAPKDKLNSAYSILYLGYNLGMAIGPALAGFLFNNYLNLLFLIDAMTCVISTSLVFFFVPYNSKSKMPQKKRAEQFDINSYKDILKSSALIGFSIVLLCYNFCYAQWGFMLPLQITSIFNTNGAKYYSLLVSVNAISVIFFTPLLTSLTRKFRPLGIIAVGGIFYIASFFIFGVGKEMFFFVVSTVILTMGQILININTNIYIAEKTPQKALGRAISLLNIVNGAGVAIGPIIMGMVLTYINYTEAWLFVAVLMFAGTARMFILNRKSIKSEFI